ncbi:MAG: hypothetical protein NTX81_01680, partial [Candidatus Bathyarchaeota archaeon]|nr:hypothetical protein [Candidatus Bathyarchaeota archaeon]
KRPIGMKTESLQRIRGLARVMQNHLSFVAEASHAMEIAESVRAISSAASEILVITGQEKASTSEFVPCRTDYHVCAECLQVIRSLAHIIEGESEEDRPFPEADDAWNRAKDSGMLCGGDHCQEAKKWSRV